MRAVLFRGLGIASLFFLAVMVSSVVTLLLNLTLLICLSPSYPTEFSNQGLASAQFPSALVLTIVL